MRHQFDNSIFFFIYLFIYPGTSTLAKLIANLNGALYPPTHSQKWEEARRCRKSPFVRVMQAASISNLCVFFFSTNWPVNSRLLCNLIYYIFAPRPLAMISLPKVPLYIKQYRTLMAFCYVHVLLKSSSLLSLEILGCGLRALLILWLCMLARCVKKHSAACKTCRKSGSGCPRDQTRLWITHSLHLMRTSATRCCMALSKYHIDRLQRQLRADAAYHVSCSAVCSHLAHSARDPSSRRPLYLTELVQV